MTYTVDVDLTPWLMSVCQGSVESLLAPPFPHRVLWQEVTVPSPHEGVEDCTPSSWQRISHINDVEFCIAALALLPSLFYIWGYNLTLCCCSSRFASVTGSLQLALRTAGTAVIGGLVCCQCFFRSQHCRWLQALPVFSSAGSWDQPFLRGALVAFIGE